MNNTFTEHVVKNIELALNFTKTNFNLLLVIMLAGGGLSTVILNPDSFTTHTPSTVEVWKPRIVSNSANYAVRVLERESPSLYDRPQENRTLLAKVDKPTLKVAGIREIDEALTFAVSNFNEDINYLIDFGNGTTKTLSQAAIPHKYQEPGTYKVRVIGEQAGERKVLSTKFLMVADAMETPAFIAESQI